MRHLVAAIFLAASASAQVAEVPLDLKGIRPGMSEAEVKGVFPNADCYDKDDSRYCYISKPTFAGEEVKSLFVDTSGGAVVSILVSFEERRFSAVSESLKAKFGSPASEEVGVIENRMGAKFENRTLTWKQGDSVLLATQRSGSIDKSSVSLRSESAVAAEVERKKQLAAKAANDL